MILHVHPVGYHEATPKAVTTWRDFRQARATTCICPKYARDRQRSIGWSKCAPFHPSTAPRRRTLPWPPAPRRRWVCLAQDSPQQPELYREPKRFFGGIPVAVAGERDRCWYISSVGSKRREGGELLRRSVALQYFQAGLSSSRGHLCKLSRYLDIIFSNKHFHVNSQGSQG